MSHRFAMCYLNFSRFLFSHACRQLSNWLVYSKSNNYSEICWCQCTSCYVAIKLLQFFFHGNHFILLNLPLCFNSLESSLIIWIFLITLQYMAAVTRAGKSKEALIIDICCVIAKTHLDLLWNFSHMEWFLPFQFNVSHQGQIKCSVSFSQLFYNWVFSKQRVSIFIDTIFSNLCGYCLEGNINFCQYSIIFFPSFYTQ